jgi:thiamine-monophosphate kinase
MGEFQLIRRITSGWRHGSDVLIGLGDDASAVRSPGSNLLFLQTTDTLVEEVDFHKGWGTPRQLGHKALAANLSDIAAMGGKPRYAHLALAIPATWTQENIVSLTQGFALLANSFEVDIIGGDLSATSGPLVINVMVTGEAPEQLVLRRSGAKPGDVIWVSGTMGDAAGGLKLLQGGMKRLTDHFASAFLTPRPQIACGLVCAESRAVNAMIDISDGLAGDLGHIMQASGVGAVIEEKKLPVSIALRNAVRWYGWDLLDLMLHGGEDFELLGCSPPESFDKLKNLVMDKTGETLTAIGRIVESPELTLLRSDGSSETIAPQAYEHVLGC